MNTRLPLVHRLQQTPRSDQSGLGCTTTSQTNPKPRLNLLGANWRPWYLKLKLSPKPNGGLHGRSCRPVWTVRASGLSCGTSLADLSATLAVNRLARGHATRPSYPFFLHDRISEEKKNRKQRRLLAFKETSLVVSLISEAKN